MNAVPQPPVFSTALPDNVLRDVRARCYYAAAHAPSTPEAERTSGRIIDGWYCDGRDEAIEAPARWEQALRDIAAADPLDLALDPNWPQRIAREALEGGEA